MSLSRGAAGVALVCVMGWSGGVLAADPPATATDAQNGNKLSTTAAAHTAYVDGFGQAVSAGSLGGYSGGSSLVQSNQTLTGTVSGDSASQVSTGNNTIAGGSFAGASGLPSVIQNTGNNVLIQNGVIVNVQLKP
jgi:hypothetical protein